MAEYRLTPYPDFVQHALPDGLIETIPDNPDNPSWQKFQAWLGLGNVADPFVAPPPDVPPELTKYQFWLRLAQAGHIDEAEAVDAMGGDLPNDIKNFINTLPAAQRFAARMFFLRDTIYRDGTATAHTMTLFAVDAATMDQFFIDAALL